MRPIHTALFIVGFYFLALFAHAAPLVFNWTDNSEGDASEDSFELVAVDAEGAPTATLASVEANVTTLSIDAALVAGKRVAVRARNIVGVSGLSNILEIPNLPPTPSGLRFTITINIESAIK